MTNWQQILFVVAVVLLTLFNAQSVKASASNDTLLASGEAIDRHDYQTALKLLQPLAEQGNAAAQYELGYLYETQAIEWFRKSAVQGNDQGKWALKNIECKR